VKHALRSLVVDSYAPRKPFQSVADTCAKVSPVGYVQAQLEAILLDESRGHWPPLGRAAFVLLTCGSFWAAVCWSIAARF
jgi:hypothetical protein